MTEVTQVLLWEACACTPKIGYGKEEWVNGIKLEESGKWKRNPVKTPERTIEVGCRQKLFDPFLGAGAAGFDDSCLSCGIYCSPHCPKR